jgi:hypothetical protein
MSYADIIGHESALAPERPGTLGEAQYLFPTTIAQQSLWYLDRLQPGNPAWNIAVRFRLVGPLNIAILERALNEIVRRHEILRTTFCFADHSPVQIVHNVAAIPLPLEDLSHLTASERDSEEERRTIAEGSRPFDLESGPLLRARVLRFAPHNHMLLLTVHHIVSDGWSIGVIADELATQYEALLSGCASVPTLPLQYADYAVWQNQRNARGLAEHRAYWQKKLANLPVCEIPTDYPRPPVQTHNGYILSTVLPVPLTEKLLRLSKAQNCTFYVTALTALKVLIAHYTKQNDIYLGTLVAGRDRLELEPLIGLFINTIVLRTDVCGYPSFLELMERVRETVEDGLAHQDLHFRQVVEALRLKRDRSRPTLCSINFIYQRDFIKPREFAGIRLTPVPSKSPGAIYDLNFFMVERSDGWRLSCEYNYDLYAATSINVLIGQLRSLFEQIAENPARLISQFSFPALAAEPLPPFVPAPTSCATGVQTPALHDLTASYSSQE